MAEGARRTIPCASTGHGVGGAQDDTLCQYRTWRRERVGRYRAVSFAVWSSFSPSFLLSSSWYRCILPQYRTSRSTWQHPMLALYRTLRSLRHVLSQCQTAVSAMSVAENLSQYQTTYGHRHRVAA
eukprot:3305839-Rhodomonas_salina.1